MSVGLNSIHSTTDKPAGHPELVCIVSDVGHKYCPTSEGTLTEEITFPCFVLTYTFAVCSVLIVVSPSGLLYIYCYCFC